MRRSSSQQNRFGHACNLHGHGEPEPIGLEYVAASVKSLSLSCMWRSPQELRLALDSKNIIFSFFSSTTHEYPKVLEAAMASKARGEITVLGGYHACGCQDDLVTGPFDYIVLGEGELVAPAIAKAFISGSNNELDGFESCSVGPVHIVRAPRILDLDALPVPLRTEKRLEQYRIYDLMWPPASRQRNAALVLGSRGCANDCDFCASSTVWGHGIRLRSVNRIVDELRDLILKFGTNTVVFIDQSLGQSKQWALDLCVAIKTADLDIHWYHQSNLTIDLDVIRAMAGAGCSKIGFGLEGISPRAISVIKPANTCDINSINSLFDYCNRLGIFVKAYLMIGFPWETEDIIREYFEWLPRIRANQIKISYFTPFPGTRDWTRFRNQIITSDWSDFDTVRMPVVYNPNISIERYQEIRLALFRSFYGSRTYADVTRRIIGAYPHYIDSYWEFADYLYHFNLVPRDAAWLDYLHYGTWSKTPVAVGR